MAHKILKELTEQHPTVRLEAIDALRHPLQTWSAGVRMIPALKIDDDMLSAVVLQRQQIADFLARHMP